MPYLKERPSEAGSRLGKGSPCFSRGISVERTKNSTEFLCVLIWDKAERSITDYV